jgi:hypothetical protein
MIEDETATGEGMPEKPDHPDTPGQGKKAAARAQDAEAPTTTTLTVSGPPWCTGMRLTLADGSTLLVTRKGADVPADQAAALINTAAKHGVTLRSN